MENSKTTGTLTAESPVAEIPVAESPTVEVSTTGTSTVEIPTARMTAESPTSETPAADAQAKAPIPFKAKRSGPKARYVSFGHQVWYQFCKNCMWIVMKVFFFVRYKDKRNVPNHGPVLVVSNHQSFLDPPAVGAGILRRMNYLARKTLFRFKPFGWLIDSVDAIPLDQEGIGFAGIKETLRRLKNNEAVLIFPEGARSEDGEIQPFKAGFVTLAVRSKATIVPTAIAGAFEAWPRHGSPRPFRPIRVQYGKPIPFEEYSAFSEEELHQRIENNIREMYESIRRKK